MKKRYWYGLDIVTNPIGFGCWQISGIHSNNGMPHGWGKVEEKDAINLLVRAIDSGIDFFDTAQGYNNGKSEELLGKAIRQIRKDVVVCTKIVLTESEIKNKILDDNFAQRIETSLKRIGTYRIDILLFHNPPDELDWKTFDFTRLNELQKDGKIGTYGVSSRGLNGALKVLEAEFGTVLEWVFNIFERRPEKELFSLVEQNNFNFIARSPLSRGLINPKYLEKFPAFSDDDFRSTLPKEWIEWVINSLKIFHNNGVANEEIVKQSILYCVQHKEATCAIIGIKTQEQLDSVLKICGSVKNEEHFNNNFLEGISECFPKWR